MKPQSISPLRSKALAYTNSRSKTRIERCQQMIGYTFKDKSLIREALTPRHSGNQRLALAGDRAADLHLATQWYANKGRLTPSQWNRMKADMLANTKLEKVGRRLRVQDYALSWCPNAHMATTVEAIIGAVWFDSNGDAAALDSVMHRFGLDTHPLLSPPPPPTTLYTTADSGEISSNRPLPSRFFHGHHRALSRLLSNHSHTVQQRPGRRSHLSRPEHEGDHGTGTPPTGMWSRLKSVLSNPKITVDTALALGSVADPPGRKHKHHVQEPSPGKPTKPSEQHATTSPVLATNKQTDPSHYGSKQNSTLPAQQPVVQSGHASGLAGRYGESTGWPPEDTEWNRIQCFIWSIGADQSRTIADRIALKQRLLRHRQVLANLPDKSLKSISNEYSTDGVYLTTHSADDPYDQILARHVAFLTRDYKKHQSRHKKRCLHPEEKMRWRRLEKQLKKIWSARLELWLPPNAQASEVSTSSPESGPTSVSSSKTPPSGLPVTIASDPMASSTALPSGYRRPERSDPVLWTSNVARRKSVTWRNYLENPTSANEHKLDDHTAG